MSHLLEFSSIPPQPHDLRTPPYVVFGVNGTDITSSLPPLIPLSLVLHFAPALRKWVLPSPDPEYLPKPLAHQSLRTPHVGINILAPIDAVGLGWIILRMLHLSGYNMPRETFSVHPDLETSLAIHNAWLALELPFEGLRSLHTHIHAQLLLNSSRVSLWDMRMLWDTFPHDSQIVWAMGLNCMQARVSMDSAADSLEIMAWFQSSPELYAFFERLRDAIPEAAEGGCDTVTIPAVEAKEKIVGTGYETIGRKTRKAMKKIDAAKGADDQVDIMERGATRKVSYQEKQEREESDFEALKMRLRRTRSDDSLRSVDTAIWDPQIPEDDDEEEEAVTGDMNDSKNYSGGSISAALARTLESIRVRREARASRSKPSAQSPSEDVALVNQERSSIEVQPRFRHRRSSSTSASGRKHGLSITDLATKIQVLKEKQNKIAQEAGEEDDVADDESENSLPGSRQALGGSARMGRMSTQYRHRKGRAPGVEDKNSFERGSR